MAALKPPTPLLTPNRGALKPASPLRPKNAPKTPISHPQRRWRFQSRLGRHPQRRQGFQSRLDRHPQRRQGFQSHTSTSAQRRRRFQTTAHLADRARLRYPWAEAGPGRATSGRPTLQTSSNQRDSNRLARTPVTNVVNLSPKTTIFSEKALGLTTFVTTRQKTTRKTPWIDDVCNNTHPSTPKTQHARPPHDAHRKRRGLAGLRDDAPISDPAPLVWRAPEGPQGQAAVPVGGGGAWPAPLSTKGPTGVEGAGGTGGHGRASRRGAERSEAA